MSTNEDGTDFDKLIYRTRMSKRKSPSSTDLISVPTIKDDPDEVMGNSTLTCFLCLRNKGFRGDVLEKKPDCKLKELNIGSKSDLCSRFFHFCTQYLKVDTFPDELNLGNDFDAFVKENVRFDFCAQCERMVNALLNIYGEMTTLKARLLWSVGQLGEILRVSSKRKSNYSNSTREVQIEKFCKFRCEVEEKCHLKAQIIQPEVCVVDKQLPISTTRSGRQVKRPNSFLDNDDDYDSPPSPPQDQDPLDPDWNEAEDSNFLNPEEFMENVLKEEVVLVDTATTTTTTTTTTPKNTANEFNSQVKRQKIRPLTTSSSKHLSSRNPRRILNLNKRKNVSHLNKKRSGSRKSSIGKNPISIRHPTTHNCSDCSDEFRNRLSLLQHMAMVHEGLADEFLKCTVCHETLEGFFDLQKHLEEIHEVADDKPIYCVFCYQRFTTQQLSDLHRREQHSKVYLARCPLLFCDNDDCPEKFMSVIDLNKHLQTHVPITQGTPEEGVFVCQKCGRGFLNSTRCELHQIIHLRKDSEGFYHCPQFDDCQIRLKGQRKLLNHYNKKHVDVSRRLALHACDLCKKRPYFISRKDLETHSKRHALELKCRICGEVCLGSNELIVHKYNKHPEEFNYKQMPKIKPPHENAVEVTNNKTPSSAGSDKQNDSITTGMEEVIVAAEKESELTGLLRKCAYCKKKFVTFAELEKHKATEHGINANRPQPGRLVCDICGLVVSYKGTLARHMLTHSEPTIECPYKCGKMFRRTGNMEMHILKTHKKGEYEPQFVCDVCGRGYLSRGLLNRHKKEHEKLIKCPICSKMVRTTSRLKEHLRATHSTERFNCKWCSSVYTWETKLIAHVKKKHPEHYDDYYAERVKWRTFTKINENSVGEEHHAAGDFDQEVASASKEFLESSDHHRVGQGFSVDEHTMELDSEVDEKIHVTYVLSGNAE